MLCTGMIISATRVMLGASCRPPHLAFILKASARDCCPRIRCPGLEGQILAYRVSFGAKTAGARIDPSARLILCLERVDQVELQPVKVRFRLARAYPGGLHGILQKGVQSASMPPSEAGHGVAARLP